MILVDEIGIITTSFDEHRGRDKKETLPSKNQLERSV